MTSKLTFTDEDLKRFKEAAAEIEEDRARPWIEASKLKALIARLEAAEKGTSVLDDIQYCFQNVWALDRKKFEEEFIPKIKDALDAWRKAAGK